MNKRGKNPTRRTQRDVFVLTVATNVAQRCEDPEDKGFEFYGGRGIEARLSIADLEWLYERDRPDLMIRPSLDRIDNDGHYERLNCRFLEMIDNAARRSWDAPKQCTVCGGFDRQTRKMRGKILCPSCYKSAVVTLGRVPRYVQHTISKAESLGFNIDRRLVHNETRVSAKTLLINGSAVHAYCCRTPFRPSSANKSKYWRFRVNVGAGGFFILAARQSDSNYRFFVVPSEVCDEHWVYIPTRRRRSVRWYQYENAWHLLTPAKEIEAA